MELEIQRYTWEGFKTAPSTIAASIKMLVNKSMKDRGFLFYRRNNKNNKRWWAFFIFVISAITISLIFMTYYKYSEYLELSIYLFITTGLLSSNYEWNQTIFSICNSFFRFSNDWKQNWKVYIPIVLICSMIHKSALIFLPLYFFCESEGLGGKWRNGYWQQELFYILHIQ